MFLTNQLTPAKNSHRRKRVGRGIGSGRGTYSGSGNKGQHSRGSGKVPLTFTGGENAVMKSAPKLRGFKPLGLRPVTITVSRLMAYFKEGDIISTKSLFEKGLLTRINQKFKIVSTGDLTIKLNFDKDVRLTKSLQDKIKK
jgi:large subunit ribosomal protein L15